MKKIRLSIIAFAATFVLFTPNVNAKEFTTADLKDLSETSIMIDGVPTTIEETVYVFGKHVYFNKITVADIVEAAATLNGDTSPILYYKNGQGQWKNNVTNAIISDANSLKFDILKIVKPQVADEEAITGKGNVIVEDNNIIETFDSEDTLVVKSIKKGNAVEIGENTDNHSYNQQNISLDFDANKGILNITENENLIAYNNGNSSQQWYSIIVELGTPIFDGDGNSLISAIWSDHTSYNIETIDVEDVVRHGGIAETSFVMWLKGSDEDYSKSLVLMNTHTNEVKILKINYIAKDGFNYNAADPELVHVTTDGVNYNAEKERFTIEPDITEFEFTDNEILYKAIKDENTSAWEYYQCIVFKSAEVATSVALDDANETTIHAWNQGGLSLPDGNIVEEDNSATIKLESSRVLQKYINGSGRNEKWYALIVDLGVDPTKLTTVAGEGLTTYQINDSDITDAARHGATTSTSFIMWVSDIEKTYKFIYDGNESNNYTIELQNIEYTYDDLKLSTIKKTNADTNVEDYTTNHAYNQDSFNIDEPIYDEETDTTTVVINEQRTMNKYNNTISNEKWYAVLVDFGIALDDISAIAPTYTIEDVDKIDAARHGATGTEFVMWLKGSDIDSSREIEFKNEATGDTVKVNFEFSAVKEFSYNAGENEVTEISNDGVIYDTTRNVFIYRAYEEDQITSFTALVGADEYKFDFYENSWHAAKTLRLVNAIKTNPLDNYTLEQNTNQNGISDVTIDDNTVTVIFDRTLATLNNGAGTSGKWYAIALNLGVNKDILGTLSGYSIETADKTEVQYHLNETDYNENYVIVWMNANLTNTDAGKTIKFYNTNNEKTEYRVKIKSQFAESEEVEYLNLNNAKKISLDNITEDHYYDEMLLNNNLIESVSVNSTNSSMIDVIFTDELTSYDNGHSNAKWYGILIDMNILKENLGTTSECGYTIEDIDKTDAYRFGGITDNNEILLWLKADETNLGKTITFKNIDATDATNPFNTFTMKINSRQL